jgi:acetolactate synthase-1/2/3 large subunit
VNIVWENSSSGRSCGSRTRSSAATSASTSRTPDFVKLAEAFGHAGLALRVADDFGSTSQWALALDLPSLIVLPIDYSIDVAYL